MCLHSGVVDAQELSRARHSVDVEVFALGALFVHELKDRVGGIGVLEDGAGDLEEGPAQMGRTTLGDAAGLGIEGARLEGRRVHG